MWKNWKHPPFHTIRKGTNGVFTAILAMVHGDFTGKISTRSRNKVQEIYICLFDDNEKTVVVFFYYIIATSEKYLEE